MKLKIILFLSICFVTNIYSSSSAYESYNKIVSLSNEKKWNQVIEDCKNLIVKFPRALKEFDLYYHLGSAYYEIGEYKIANEEFSKYLDGDFSPKFYEKSIEYKFSIAKKYQEGVKTNLFNLKILPKWVGAKDKAIEIFDEVLKALPNSELAAASLYYKGVLSAGFLEYQEAIDNFQTLIRRFPKHDLAVESFLYIGKIYLKQADPKHPEADLLDLAAVNLRRFEEAFPKEPMVEYLKKDVESVKEIYAKSLLEIAKFYSRVKKKEAAKIYYEQIVIEFPETKTASLAHKWLKKNP